MLPRLTLSSDRFGLDFLGTPSSAPLLCPRSLLYHRASSRSNLDQIDTLTSSIRLAQNDVRGSGCRRSLRSDCKGTSPPSLSAVVRL